MKDPFDTWLDGRPKDDAPPDGELLPGTVVDAYRIVALLGRGGFAEVYRATDESGVPVAIKLLHRLDDRSRLRFNREKDVLFRIRHPNMPRLLDFGVCGSRPYLVTELLRPLELPRTDRAVARLLRKMISVVAELHRNGWIHRDIKPSNVMVRNDGEPVLIDFGLVCPREQEKKRTEGVSVDKDGAVVVGTPEYAAPEQFSGQPTGPEADVHALGALVNACFAGNVPRCWRAILLKATNSKPENRYRSVGALERVVAWRHWRRNALVGLGVAVLAGLMSLGIVWWQEEQAKNRQMQAIEDAHQDIQEKLKSHSEQVQTNESNVIKTRKL